MIQNIFNFDFLEKDLGIVFPPYFVYHFSRKMFVMLYSIKWPNYIPWMLLLLEILGNMCIVIVCFPSWEVINFEIKGALSGVRQFLATESPLKMTKNAFLFHLFVLFSLSRYLNFCLDFLVMYKKGLIRKIYFKIYEVTAWLTNKCNTHIDQHLKN